MIARVRVLVMMIAGGALVGAPALAPQDKCLILNTTASAPLGLYWLDKGLVGVGDLSLVRPPPDLARWMAARRYLPLNVPLIKQIAAVEGQFVCVRAGAVFVDGDKVAAVLPRDRLGRILRPSSVCRRLQPDEVFLLNTQARSLDGRYFGPLPRRSVMGRLTPLWTWAR